MSAIDRAIEALEADRKACGACRFSAGVWRSCTYHEGMADGVELANSSPSIGEEPAREEVTLEGLTIEGWRERCIASDRDRGYLAAALAAVKSSAGQAYVELAELRKLDGAPAPVGQVLTRADVESLRNDLASLSAVTRATGMWEAYEAHNIGVKRLDALLDKFGAAPQVRECPRDHQVLLEVGFKFCGTCGAALETGE